MPVGRTPLTFRLTCKDTRVGSPSVDRPRTAIRHLPCIAALCVALSAAGCTPDPSGKVLSFGTSEKVCQLTGDRDWATSAETTARSGASFGLVGTDLGYPVEHNGKMALLFGDSRTEPPRNAGASGPPDDAVGWVTTRAPPSEQRCTDMTINHSAQRNPISPVVGPPAIKQGLFNVPSGGVSSDGVLYAFFWTDHCSGQPNVPCPESDSLNSIGRGVLARSSDAGQTFVNPVLMPRDFVYSTAVDSKTAVGLPAEQRIGVYVFGVPRYRESVPYLAYAPLGATGDPSAWLFFVGRKPDGQPMWVTRDAWESRPGRVSPPGHPDLFDATDRNRCVGEFSVTWNSALHAWLLLYNCNLSETSQVVLARVAPAPWGPWSGASVMLNPHRDDSWCHLLWKAPGKGNGCDTREDEWGGSPETAGKLDGAFYAPFVMERYSTPVRTFMPYRRSATIYWLLSTWNPYQVIVMKTTLTVDETSPVVRAVIDRAALPTR